MTFPAEIKQLTSDLHLVLILRMTGTVPPRPTCLYVMYGDSCTRMECTWTFHIGTSSRGGVVGIESGPRV